jgi:uncharacterized protein (TIGR03437 family)
VAHTDYSVVGRGDPIGSTPAVPGEAVVLFGTGFDPMQPPVEEGQLPPFAASLTLPSRVFLGGLELPEENVLYVGQAPFFAGLQQVNIRLPDALPKGDYEVVVELAGATTQIGVMISVDAPIE